MIWQLQKQLILLDGLFCFVLFTIFMKWDPLLDQNGTHDQDCVWRTNGSPIARHIPVYITYKYPPPIQIWMK